MKTPYLGALAASLLITTAAFAATSNPDAGVINRFFADILLVVNNLKALIEPLVGLAIAVMIAMQYVSLRRQKVAKDERASQTEVLAAQNTVLADVRDSVEHVKAAVTPSVSPEDKS